MKYIGLVFILLQMICLQVYGQSSDGVTLKPNLRRIAKEVVRVDGEYYYDSLVARFERCDEEMDIDQLRCLYFGGDSYSVAELWRVYEAKVRRFGRHAGAVNDVWWQYQMLVSAVWSTGDGSRKCPLYVNSKEDAEQVAEGYDSVLWFRKKGSRRRFSVAPPQ